MKLSKSNFSKILLAVVLGAASFSATAGTWLDSTHYQFANGTIATVTFNADGSIAKMTW